MRLPVDEDIMSPVFVIEVGHQSLVAPKNLFIVYCWCESESENAKTDLLPVAKRLFTFNPDEVTKPKIIWCAFYNQLWVDARSLELSIKENLHITSPPAAELDYDAAIAEVRFL